LLSTGALTDFAARIVRGETAAMAAMPTGPIIIEEPVPVAPAQPEAPEERSSDEPLLLTPATPQVIDLAERRKTRSNRGPGVLKSAGRGAAMTASVLFVLGIAVEGTGRAPAITETTSSGAACESADAPSDNECSQIAEAHL